MSPSGSFFRGARTPSPKSSPADIPRLQSEIAVSPEDTDLQVRLGMAQYMAEDFDQALATLQGAIDEGNESGVAFLYLGMTHESSENWPGARDAYSRYLEVGTSDPLKGGIAGPFGDHRAECVTGGGAQRSGPGSRR